MNRPRVLIFGRNEGAPYHPLAAIEAELSSLFEDFEVTIADSAEPLLALGSAGRSGPDLLVGLDDRWDDPQQREVLDAVEAWLRAGGTLLLIHNGICWANDPRWRRLAGGRFTGHGPAQNLVFTRADGARFELFEEPYRFSTPWFSGNCVLVTYEDEGKSWPAFWTRRVGGGRLAYALPGHGVHQFRHAGYRAWLVEFASALLSGTPVKPFS